MTLFPDISLVDSDDDSSIALSPLRIVLVEDCDHDAVLLKVHLRKAGLSYTMRRCYTEEALRATLTEPTDIVLSDYSLPQFSGLKAIAVVRELCPDVPVIIVSGAIGEEAAVEAIREGAVDYILKDRPGRLSQAIQQSVVSARMRSRLDVERRNLTTALARLEKLSAALVNAQEQERQHLARELHDELGQELTGLNMLLHSLQSFIPDDAGRRALSLAEHTATSLIGRVRNLSTSLRPPALDMFGLEISLRQLLARHFSTLETAYVLEFVGVPAALHGTVEITAYRLVQECVTNISRHARARQVVIEISSGDGADELAVSVRDDGVGFDPDAADGIREPILRSTGLLGMRERVQLLGGAFAIESQAGQGTKVTATLPLATEVS